MADERDNVLPFKPKAPDVEGHMFVAACHDEVARIISGVRDLTVGSGGFLSVIVMPPPEGCAAWDIRDPELVEWLGVKLIQLAGLMRRDADKE